MNTETKQNDARREQGECCCEECESRLQCDDEVLLQEVYRIAVTGMSSIDMLRPHTEEKSLNTLFNKQYANYKELSEEAAARAKDLSIELKSPNTFAKVMMYGSVLINTLADKSSSKVAEIMLQGINMGVISLTKVINGLNADVDLSLANRLSGQLDNDITNLKMFL